MDKNLGLRLWEGPRVTTRSSSCFLVNLAPGRHLGGVLSRAGENGGTFRLPQRERRRKMQGTAGANKKSKLMRSWCLAD